VQFGPKGSGAGGSGGSYSGGRGKDSKNAAPTAEEGSSNGVGIEYPAEEINPDDIPF